MHKIGLTGGIASGKSTVSGILKEMGASVIDADIIAREVVQRESPCLEEIVKRFGREILLDDGQLDRKKLRDIVFASRKNLDTLNRIVHPTIIFRIKSLLEAMEKAGKTDRVVVDAAILIETGLHKLMDSTWLVSVTREVQIERLVKRDGISRERAEDIIRSQMPIEDKKRYADLIIDNNGSVEDLKARVQELWRRL